MAEFAANFSLNNNSIDAQFDLSEGAQFDALFEIYAAGTVWGTITGTLSNQTDLQAALNLKADKTELNSAVLELNTAIQNEATTRAESDTLLQNNINTLSQTVTANYNTLDGKIDTEISDRTASDTTLQNNIDAETLARQNADTVMQNNINTLSQTVTDNDTAINNKVDGINTTLTNSINSLSNTVTSNYNTLDTRITSEVSTLNTAIQSEVTNRQNADNNLQSQIDAITASSDVTDIVGTYAQLQAYDTTGLAPNSIIKVLQDENQNDETTYYRWVITDGVGSWVLIGEEGPYYTKSQADSTFVPQTRTVNGYALSNNITLTANDVGAVAPSDLATVATTGDYDDLIDKPIPPVGYGTSSTAAATATKVISIPEITELNVGQVIIVKPSTTSTVANSKIKLNDFEAYNMRYNNANITTSTDSIVWTANVASMFIFDGTYWQFLGHGLDNNTNTTYASMSVSEGITGTATAMRSLTAANLKQIIQGTKLNGLVTTDDTDVMASDSITVGIGKLQAQSTETKSILEDKQNTLNAGTDLEIVGDVINFTGTIGNGTVTINQGGTQKGTFTLNQTGNTTIDLDAGGGTVDQIFDGTSPNAQSGVAIANAKFIQNTATGYNSLTISGTASTKGNTLNIGIGSKALQNWSTALGFGAETRGESAIQIGYGKNYDELTLSVGFVDSETEYAVDNAYNYKLLDGTTGLIPDERLSTNIARTSQIPDVSNFVTSSDLSITLTNYQGKLTAGTDLEIVNNTINFTNESGYITANDLPTNYVTTDTVQNITAKKTFIGDKAILFKQATTADKLGFTLYNASNTELAAFEFRPSTIGSSALFNLNLSKTSTNYVTTDTVQNITGEKTFVGDKRIKFKQATTSDKLGFTLYNASNTELAAFEFRPSTIGSSALFNLNLSKTSANYVGFRYHGTNAINIAAPKVATAGNYYIPINFTDGTNTVTADNVGTVNLSTLLPTVNIDIDNTSITTNTSDELQTVGVIDQNNNTTAIKTWTGTKAQYDAIVTKDANTLYNITDDTDTTLSLLELLYPVGSIYIGTMATCPLATLGVGTWQLVATDRVLQGAGTRGNVGTTVNESLPNIRAGIITVSDWGGIETQITGAWGQIFTNSTNLNSGSTATEYGINFDASRSSSTYQDDAPVQQNAYLVNIWERIS